VILRDTGPLAAAFNAADRDHGRCTGFLRENWPRLVVPSLAVTEVCHLLAGPQRRGRPGLAAEFCTAIAEDELRVTEATPCDYRRMAELQRLARDGPSSPTTASRTTTNGTCRGRQSPLPAGRRTTYSPRRICARDSARSGSASCWLPAASALGPAGFAGSLDTLDPRPADRQTLFAAELEQSLGCRRAFGEVG
jgi:hypothetical protein